MASKLVLILVALLLGFGSAAITFARRYTSALRGLGWLGLSFASAGIGVILLIFEHATPPLVSILISDLLVLLAFVFLHVAVIRVAASASLVPWLGIVLLILQTAAGFYRIYGGAGRDFRITIACLLIAAQTSETAHRLFRMCRRGERAPARFTGSILICVVIVNLARSFGAASGLLHHAATFIKVEEITFAVYIVAAFGIAFGFFWTSTTIRANGLEHLANTDSLTRLFNRRVFLIWCEKELIRTQKTGALFSVLMIDLDHFKQINDRYGHYIGDEVLCASVEKIQDAVRGIDVIGRWGGEEFAALLPGAGREAAFLVAERVRRNIEKVPLPQSAALSTGRASATNVTACVGISTYQGGRESVRELMQRADKALYQAKANGRNSISAEHDNP